MLARKGPDTDKGMQMFSWKFSKKDPFYGKFVRSSYRGYAMTQ